MGSCQPNVGQPLGSIPTAVLEFWSRSGRTNSKGQYGCWRESRRERSDHQCTMTPDRRQRPGSPPSHLAMSAARPQHFTSTCTPSLHPSALEKLQLPGPIPSSHSIIVARRAAFLYSLFFSRQPLIRLLVYCNTPLSVGISSTLPQHTLAPISRVQHALIVGLPPPFLFHLSTPATPSPRIHHHTAE